MTRKFLFCVVILSSFSLSACGGVKEQLGLNKQSPDEFAVVKRAPLEMPNNYSLVLPRPGAPRPQEQAAVEQAKQTVLGTTEQSAGEIAAGNTQGEAILLQTAGANTANPNIRATVDSESAKLQDRNKTVAQKLLGIGGDKNLVSATVVDAAAEAERLQANKQQGKPATEGETPSIEE